MAVEHGIERRIVSVLFADLVGFTSLSEQLDAEDVDTIQQTYFATVRETVGRYGGRLEKFIGDAAMAVFGAPRVRDDDAERAVRAGLALVSAVEQVAGRLDLEPGALRLRVGVNTGEVVYHPGAGEDEALVTGDAVNVAARFQSAAPPGGVLFGEMTALAVAEAVELEDAGSLELKGKAEPVRAWRATRPLTERSRDRAMGSLSAPTLGREAELAELAAALDGVTGGGSGRRLVVAEPGVGKTRLLDELARRTKDAVVLRARVRPDALGPYDPVAQLVLAALGPVSEIAPALAERLGDSARAQVVREQVLALLWPTEDRAVSALLPEEREARFEAWLEALDQLAANAKSLWLVEDAHWAGGDLLAFLAAVGDARSAAGRLVVATARPALLEREPDWCADSGVLHLPPLSPDDTAELVGRLVGDALPPELVERIAERSDGNPLFVEELLRTWISVGLLERDGDRWRLAEEQEIALPATVQSLYAAQLDDLPEPARLVARRAAVAGRRFPEAGLEPLGIPDGRPGIDVLLRRALVRGPEVDRIAGDSYVYRHALLRDAGYASLARADRARLHARFARWLETAAGDRHAETAELIARHLAAALESAPALASEIDDGLDRGETARLAALWFDRAAEAALGLAAHDTARSLLRRALELTPDDAVLDRSRRLARLGEATAFTADMHEGAAALVEAATGYAEAFRDAAFRDVARAGLARTTALLAAVYFQQLRFADAVAAADAALGEIGVADDADTARLLLARARARHGLTNRPEDLEPDAERAHALARAHGDAELELDSLRALAVARSESGRAGANDWAAVEELARRTRRWQAAVGAIVSQAGFHIDDRAETAEDLLDRAQELAEAHGLTEGLAWCDHGRVEAGLVSGAWDEALAAGRRVLELGERYGYDRAVVRTWFALVPIAAERGERELLEQARDWLDERLEGFPHSPYGITMHLGTAIRIDRAGVPYSFEPEVEPVLEAFALERSGPSWFAATEAVLERWIEQGRFELVEGALERSARWRGRTDDSILGRGSDDLVGARLLLARGDVVESRRAARAAFDRFREVRAPWWTARASELAELAVPAD